MRKLSFSLLALSLSMCWGQDARAVQNAFAKLPLSFEANRGQTDARVKYLSRGPGYTLFLTETEVVLAGRDSRQALRLRLNGANPRARLEALDPLPGITNYFIGTDPSKWRTRIPNYSRVALRDVYPGIDLVFYGNQRELEYDAIVAPGADPKAIRVHFEGAEKMVREPNGDLLLSMGGAEIRQRKPYITQAGHPIEGGYTIDGREVAFNIARYDHSQPLVIDPAFIYSTYVGGTAAGSVVSGTSIAVDQSGYTYITGNTTNGIGFPLINALQGNFGGGGSDAVVVKINPQGTAFVYATFLGGAGYDVGTAIAADATGSAYVAGYAEAGFPGAGGRVQGGFAGGTDAFVAKLDPAGASLTYSTYLGGPGNDQATGIAVDSAGNAYVTGSTEGGLPVTNAAQKTYGGGTDAFVAVIQGQGGGLLYATYLGGTGTDQAYGIAVDSGGNAYVTGSTTSDNFPVSGALQSSRGGATDAFVTKFSPGGNILYSTYLGGTGADAGRGIAVDSAGSAYVAGSTTGSFPVVNAFQSAYGGGTQAGFVSKLSPQGNALVYSTYLGGTANDSANGIAVDAAGSAMVTGFTAGGFPVTDNSKYSGGFDAFVTVLTPQGNGLIYSIYVGGSAYDLGYGIATDVNGTAYITGITYSNDFPQFLPIQNNQHISSATSEAFVTLVARSANRASLAMSCSHSGTFALGAQNVTLSLTVSNKSGSPPTSGVVTVNDTIPSGLTLAGMSGPGWSCNSNTCSRMDVLSGGSNYPPITALVNVASNAPAQVINQATVFGGGSTASVCSDVINIGSTPAPTAPFGSFDTPANNTTNIAGAVAVTGWALDASAITRVEIWRDSVAGDPTPNNGQIFIGLAVFVPGARPDVQNLYPNYPNANRAGWGYMLLTNFLPNGGNGNFRLHAYAFNNTGGTTELSPPGKNISCDNLHANKPFGTLDTPGQGDTVSGSQFINFGWALTPGGFFIPFDGSTISVFVDGAPLGHPVYNQFRNDIATQFPGYNNSNGAVGYFFLNTTGLTNGIHTIAWNVFDNGGRGDGIGSRYFTVQNPAAEAMPDEPVEMPKQVTVTRGYDSRAKPEVLHRLRNGAYSVQIEELGRIELHAGVVSGHQVVNGEEQPLPAGSTIKGGVFYWQPGPAFLGDFELVLDRPDGEQVPVRVKIAPKTFVQ